jgi:hypothetical protein
MHATDIIFGNFPEGLLPFLSFPPALADLHPLKLELGSHRIVGTEVGLRLVPRARSIVGPGVPGAPNPVATGRHRPGAVS